MTEAIFQHSSVIADQSSPEIVLMEDHDGAYHAWKNSGLKNRILLHFDAHFDFGWIAPQASTLLEETTFGSLFGKLRQNRLWSLNQRTPEERVHLGNYIHEAIRQGLIREFFWIYPADSNSEMQRRTIRDILNVYASFSPSSFHFEETTNNGTFKGKIYDIPFHVTPYCEVFSLKFDESILLDIDLDFFIVQSLHSDFYPYADLEKSSFWLEPASFLQDLEQSGLHSDFVTVAYSVEEGYTPLALKFLGDELAARFSGPLTKSTDKKFALLRKIVGGHGVRVYRKAWIKELEDLVKEQNDQAVLHFHLALLYLEENQLVAAREHYQKAKEFDSAYGTEFFHPGPAYLSLGRFRDAERWFQKVKSLDPDNPHLSFFKCDNLLRNKNWKAVLPLSESLLTDTEIDQAYLHYLRGLAEYRLDNPEGCLRELEGGEKNGDNQYWYLLARAAEKAGKLQMALKAYHELIKGWNASPEIHFSLARLYFRMRNFYKFRKHLGKAVGYSCYSLLLRLFRK